MTALRQSLAQFFPFEISIQRAEIWKQGTLVLPVLTLEKINQLMVAVQSAMHKQSSKKPHVTIARGIPERWISHIDTNAFHCEEVLSVNI